jgi:hypothetical protein
MREFSRPQSFVRHEAPPKPRALPLSDLEKSLLEIIVPDYEKSRLRMEDFSGFYDSGMMEKDAGELRAETRKHASKQAYEGEAGEIWLKRGKIFEAVVNSGAGVGNWFGRGQEVIITSDYDDAINYVDMVIEPEKEADVSRFALGVDVTQSDRNLEHKFEGIADSIKSGNLTEVKYFASKNYRGHLLRIPRLIVGAEHQITDRAADELLAFKTNESSQNDPEAQRKIAELKEKLENNPIQFILLLEILKQLQCFRQYAENLGKTDILGVYDSRINLLTRILDEKLANKDKRNINNLVMNDRIARAIIDRADAFKRRFS